MLACCLLVLAIILLTDNFPLLSSGYILPTCWAQRKMVIQPYSIPHSHQLSLVEEEWLGPGDRLLILGSSFSKLL